MFKNLCISNTSKRITASSSGHKTFVTQLVKYFVKNEATGCMRFQIAVEAFEMDFYRHLNYSKSYFTTNSIYSMVVKYSKDSVEYCKTTHGPKNSFFFCKSPLSVSILRNSEFLEHTNLANSAGKATFAVVYKSTSVGVLEQLRILLIDINSFRKDNTVQLEDTLMLQTEVDPLGTDAGNPLRDTEVHLDAVSLILYWRVNFAFQCDKQLPNCQKISI